MSAKSERREVIESGSPLRGHSLNQESMKIAREGWNKLVHGLSAVPQPELIGDREGLPLNLLTELPFSQAFKDRLLPAMVDFARERVEHEKLTNPTIPQRLVGIVTDGARTYRLAKKEGIQMGIVEYNNHPAETGLPIRKDTLRYPELFPRQVFLAQFRQSPVWKFMDQQDKDFLAVKVPEVLLINLTSCDFTLKDDNDLVRERVETGGYILATLGIASFVFLPKTREKVIDGVYLGYLDLLIRYFRK